MAKLRLKELIAEKGMTSAEIARRAGITTVSMSKIVNGKSDASVDRLNQFADILDAEFWELFYTREELLNSITVQTFGNDVNCPYCGKRLVLCIKQ